MEQKPKKNRIIRYAALAIGVAAIVYGTQTDAPEVAMAMIAGGFAIIADVIGSIGAF